MHRRRNASVNERLPIQQFSTVEVIVTILLTILGGGGRILYRSRDPVRTVGRGLDLENWRAIAEPLEHRHGQGRVRELAQASKSTRVMDR